MMTCSHYRRILMRISLVALLAFLGCISVSTSSAMAEYGVQDLTLVLNTFYDEDEEESEEEEGGSCTACYPPPG
jgi:hypothetical protein